LSQFSASAALDCLQTQDITMLTAVPTLLQTIAKAATRRQQTCSSLRVVIAGGSKLQPDLRTELPQVFPQADILEYFGALELSFISLASSRQSVPPGSVGRSFQGVTVSIRRQDNAGEAAVGEIGWIGVKSPMVSLGYFNSKEEAGYRLIDGWATVGDLGWRDAEGYLYLIGREQEMLVSGGVNVYPTEIEAILRSFPEIEEAAVFGLPDTDRGQAIAAAILWAGTPLTRSELQRRLQTTLPRPKLPRYFFTVDRFPRTHSGKIIRTALPAQVLSQPSLTERST
jgi:acyl-CoA synthetase (AMP-forming)/AMP-acid ligase II